MFLLVPRWEYRKVSVLAHERRPPQPALLGGPREPVGHLQGRGTEGSPGGQLAIMPAGTGWRIRQLYPHTLLNVGSISSSLHIHHPNLIQEGSASFPHKGPNNV